MYIRILGIRLIDDNVAPLAWTDREVSIKEIRRLVRKFRKDIDFVEGVVMPWSRLYSSLDEVKLLPRI